MAKHPRMLEAIEKAKAAVASTRGMYPLTPAANVIKADGTSLEETVVEPAEEEEDETVG